MSDTPTAAPTLSARFRDALVYATQLHARQTRKGTSIPYAGHLLAVAALVVEDGGTEDEAIAALLHDAVEDQGGLPVLERIRGLFGERIAEIVQGCSDSDVVDPTQKPPWRERKTHYLDHLRHTADRGLLRVSCADKLSNARAILSDYRQVGEALWARFNPDAGREGELWYYQSLADVFRNRFAGALADELAGVVEEIHRLVPPQGGHA